MRFATPTAAYYCGVDLHARTLYLVVLDQAGAVRLDRNYPAQPDAFLAAVAPSEPTSAERGTSPSSSATAGRPTTKPPAGYYRRRMKQRLNKNYGAGRRRPGSPCSSGGWARR
jgi:hypothetical protein